MLTLWCLFGSPLMVGAELTKLDDWTLSLLTNREVLAMLTPDCRPRQVFRSEDEAVWTAENDKLGTSYLALFNLSDGEQEVEASTTFAVGTELWTNSRISTKNGKLSAKLPAHGCAVYGMD